MSTVARPRSLLLVISALVASCGGGDDSTQEGAAAGTGGNETAGGAGQSDSGSSVRHGTAGSTSIVGNDGGTHGTAGNQDASGGRAEDSAVVLSDGGNCSSRPSLTAGVWKNITPASANVASTFGANDIQLAPSNPCTLWMCVDQRGMFKSTDAGSNWTKIGDLDSPLHMRVDPTNEQHLYCVQGVRGSHMGFWVSNDGGTTWTTPNGFKTTTQTLGGPGTQDLYTLATDPADFNHVLVTYHSPWANGSSGVLESTDGGATWIVHDPGSSTWATGHAITFLSDPARGLGDGHTWLLGTQVNGFWRTTNSGTTWTQVSTGDMTHGGNDVHYASSTGSLFVPMDNNVYRSTDNGATWTPAKNGVPSAYYYSVIGDGKSLYTSPAFTGSSGHGLQPYITSPESDGLTWTPYDNGGQTFTDGPYNMVFEPGGRIIYSANWAAGIWALKVPQ